MSDWWLLYVGAIMYYIQSIMRETLKATKGNIYTALRKGDSREKGKRNLVNMKMISKWFLVLKQFPCGK